MQCSPESQSHKLTGNTSLTKFLDNNCYKVGLNPGGRFSLTSSNLRINDFTKKLSFIIINHIYTHHTCEPLYNRESCLKMSPGVGGSVSISLISRHKRKPILQQALQFMFLDLTFSFIRCSVSMIPCQ
jgi:hypothetical protein